MITRPLDLASRLRPPPRSFDAWFYVSAGLVALMFALLGSRFVLAPGLEVNFRLPAVAGARAGATPTSDYITVLGSGQIFGDEGPMDLPRFRLWLQERAKGAPHPALLVKASSAVTTQQLAEIYSAAHQAGFEVVQAADDAPPAAGR
ncbi:MAG TPA: biopolymer transporter ExbD [Opitutaceae bacterium]|nr:biopolymer transporter ExbD [Opitutaceae bacterium]